MQNIVYSKRLKKEKHRSFWQTGVFRNGNINQRRAWITQRSHEQHELILYNPYYKYL